MGEQSPENEQPGTEDNGSINPAWQPILDVIPDEGLQQLIRPQLEQWDQSVNGKLQQVRERYSEYEPLAENGISREQVEQALYFANMINTDPEAVVKQAIEAFGLDYIPKSQIPSRTNRSTDDDDDYYDDDEDTNVPSSIANHPEFKAIQSQLEEMNKWREEQEEQRQTAQQTNEWNDYLKSLHENPEYGEFDDLYVTSLVQQGATPEQAIASFKDSIKSYAEKAGYAQQSQTPAPPVVMGGNPGGGTGIPANDIKMGDLSKDNVNDLVVQYLNKAQQGG